MKYLLLTFSILIASNTFASPYIGMTRKRLNEVLKSKPVSSGLFEKSFVIQIRIIKSKNKVFLVSLSDNATVVDFLDVDLKPDERFSDGASFRCHNNGKYVVGLIQDKLAKEKGYFPAHNAWSINKVAKKFETVKDISSVKCDWFQNGDEPFPIEK